MLTPGDQAAILVAELLDHWQAPIEPENVLAPGLLVRMRTHLVPVHMNGSGAGASKVNASPAPWQSDVAGLLTDVEAGVRDHEDTLRMLLGWPGAGRSAGTLAAARALRTLPDLVDRVSETHPQHRLVYRASRRPDGRPGLGEVVRDLTRWARQARILLGSEREWTRVPVACTGRPNPDDPDEVCGRLALRQRPRDGAVICGSCGETYDEAELGWLGKVAGGDVVQDTSMLSWRPPRGEGSATAGPVVFPMRQGDGVPVGARGVPTEICERIAP